jgi:exosortase D (VPLPA-CTERM-specific)
MSVGSVTATRTNGFLTGLLVAVSVVLGGIVFSAALHELQRRWYLQEEYSHGYFIPVIALWLLWTRRDALVASIGQPSWTGPALIVLAGAMHIVGELSALYILSQIGFVLVLIGITLGVGGYSLLKVAFIPIIFLLFAIPLPYFIDTVLSWRLQLISSELGVFFIRLAQVPVYLEGNVIDLGEYKLQVVEACSGLRYLYPLLGLGFLAAYLFHAPFWKRALVFLSTIPITIVMNSFRIGVVGVLVDRWGPQEADGLLHMFEGWIIFIACAALLAGEIWLLAMIGKRQSFFEAFHPPKVLPTLPPGSAWRSDFRAPLAACIVLLAAVGVATFYVSGRQEILPERTSFASFPNTIADWTGRTSTMEPDVEHFLAFTDYILSDYRKSDGKPVNLYVAYYASQRKGQSPHSPSVCIPGGGWQIAQFDRTRYSNNDLRLTLPYNRVVIEKNQYKQIVYYWFEQRGRKIENEWLSKWYLLTDAILKNRTDGALVRLTTMVYPGESEADADKRLHGFIGDVVPSLAKYLPAEAPSKIMPASNSPNANNS